jgi:hypothetical protein
VARKLSPFLAVAALGSRPLRRSGALRRALLATAAASLGLALAAAPAGAFISGAFGVQRREVATVNQEPLQYHGGPVLHSSDAYVVYWDPSERYRFDWERIIDKYFEDASAMSGGTGDVFALNSEYLDGTGRAANASTFRGAYTDTNPYPTTANGGNCTEPAELRCLTDAQIRAELQRIVTSVAPPLPGATGPAVYYLLTPPGVTVCTDAGSANTCSNSKFLEEAAKIKNPKTEKEKEELLEELKEKAESGICGYHSVVNPGGAGQVLYAAQPWIAGDAGQFFLPGGETTNTSGDVLACQNRQYLTEPNMAAGRDKFNTYAQGLADVIVNQLALEQSDTVVNPLGSGWYQTATGAEQADMCQANFGPPPEKLPSPDPHTHAVKEFNELINGDQFYVQWAFSSVGLTSNWGYYCWQGLALVPSFASPSAVNAGDIVGFDASESEVTLDANVKGLPASEPYAAPVYRWEFGDGNTFTSNANAAPVFHSYQYGGVYTVTLTVTDSGGNIASVAHTLTVIGPRPGAGAGSAGGAGGAGAGAGPAGAHAPTLAAAVSSHSLRNALRKGLKVRYSVDERVTGRFEVLLAKSVAKRVGLRGAADTGLAPGTPPQIAIGRAFLSTNAAGRNIITIHFSKSVAARLGRLHGVTLMLRVVVRNASTGSATLISTLTLSH